MHVPPGGATSDSLTGPGPLLTPSAEGWLGWLWVSVGVRVGGPADFQGGLNHCPCTFLYFHFRAYWAGRKVKTSFFRLPQSLCTHVWARVHNGYKSDEVGMKDYVSPRAARRRHSQGGFNSSLPFSQFRKPQGYGTGRFGFSRGLTPWAAGDFTRGCVWVCVFSSYKDINQTELESTLVTSFYLSPL